MTQIANRAVQQAPGAVYLNTWLIARIRCRYLWCSNCLAFAGGIIAGGMDHLWRNTKGASCSRFQRLFPSPPILFARPESQSCSQNKYRQCHTAGAFHFILERDLGVGTSIALILARGCSLASFRGRRHLLPRNRLCCASCTVERPTTVPGFAVRLTKRGRTLYHFSFKKMRRP